MCVISEPVRARREFVGAGFVVLLGACGPKTQANDSESTPSEAMTGEPTTGTNPDSSGETDSDTETGTQTDDTDGCGPEPTGDLNELAYCDLLIQDCPEGEKCVPRELSSPTWNGGYACVVVTGAGAPGESCVNEFSHDDCDATSFCLAHDEDSIDGVCHSFCTGDHEMPDCIEGWACIQAEDPLYCAGAPVYCVEQCDPLGSACGAGSVCVWSGSAFTCVEEGLGATAGEPCMLANDCGPGLSCMLSESLAGCADDSCCTSYCDVTGGDGPCQLLDANYVCEPFFTPPSDYEDLGVCVLAP